MILKKNIRHLYLIILSLFMVHDAQSIGPNTVSGCVQNTQFCSFAFPHGIAITPNGLKAYVCNANNATVSIIDVGSNTVTGCVSNSYEYCPFGNSSQPLLIAITPNGTKAYVVNVAFGAGTVSVIDVNQDAVMGCVDDTYAYCPFDNSRAIAITPDSTTAYVVNANGGRNNNGSISVIDVNQDAVIDCIDSSLCPFFNPTGIAITPDGTTAYVSNALSNSVSIIDLAYNAASGCVINTLCPFNEPSSIAITPDGLKAYVTNEGGTTVSIIDVTSHTVTGCVDGTLCPFSNPISVTITPDGTTAYVLNANNAVSIINVSSDTVTGCVNDTLCPFNSLTSMAITPDSTKGYISNFSSVSILFGQSFTTAPPTNVQGVRNCYGAGLTLTITWDASSDAMVTSYNIYNGVTFVGDVLATAPLTFSIPLVSPDEGLDFFVSAVSGYGESVLVAAETSGPISCYMPSILPPASFSGCKTRNIFLLQTDYINNLTWTAPESGTTPTSYNIYRNAYLTEFVATVSATGTLQYYDHNRNPNITYTYYIVSADDNGDVSTAESVTVTQRC